jgi:hypothetical protein
MSRAGLVTQRFLLGVPLQGLSPDRLIHLCKAIGMPLRCQELMQAQVREANLVFFGLDEDGEHGSYKVYLEFWDSVRRQVLRTRRSDPLLLHLGFKWRAEGDGGDARVARYTCFPLLSVHGILRRLNALYADDSAPEGFAAASAVIRRAASANPKATFLYVEASEEGNPRKSFDVNLYKAGLRVADIQVELQGLAPHFGIPAQDLDAWLPRIGACPLGHLAGGVDKDGRDFMTTYYETRALDA